MKMARDKRDIKPLLLKFGVALALSFAGFLYSRFRTRRIRPSHPPPSPRSSEHRHEVDSSGGRGDIHAYQTSPSSCRSPSAVSEKHEGIFIPKVAVDNTFVGLSPGSRDSGEKDRYLLPEFIELVKEFDLSATNSGFSPRKDIESPRSDAETPKAFRSLEKDDYEQEIKHLRTMVRILRERERNLEVQLLEYYGLKEQEKAVMELENRLKINNMEAKLFSLKIESLQENNRRLEAQVADYSRVVAELEAARAKIKVLKKKLRAEAEQNKEQILALQKRVTKLQDLEINKAAAASDPDFQMKIHRLEDLEAEANELRKSNKRLQLENSELAKRLESTQILATSVLEDPEAEELTEMNDRLRKENEDLTSEIEQLQADRCIDIEELVYLRWVNACLRYELRNCQPPPGKTVARDLSKTLSPKSEEKAKQLILEYANTEGVLEEKGFDMIDFDPEQWSSSQASYLTDSVENDDTSADNSSANRTNTSSKMKFLTKLRRLIRGKDTSHHHRVPPERTSSMEESTKTYNSESPHCSSSISTGIDGQSNRFATPSLSSSRHSLDIQKLKSLNMEAAKELENIQRNSDVGFSTSFKRYALGAGSPQENQNSESSQKSELVKFAVALRDSRGGTPASNSHRKSKSVGSF